MSKTITYTYDPLRLIFTNTHKVWVRVKDYLPEGRFTMTGYKLLDNTALEKKEELYLTIDKLLGFYKSNTPFYFTNGSVITRIYSDTESYIVACLEENKTNYSYNISAIIDDLLDLENFCDWIYTEYPEHIEKFGANFYMTKEIAKEVKNPFARLMKSSEDNGKDKKSLTTRSTLLKDKLLKLRSNAASAEAPGTSKQDLLDKLLKN